MNLYKSRDFNEYFSDTFTFIGQNWSHYFKNYFSVNGIFLLLLLAIGYATYSVFPDSETFTGSNAGEQVNAFANENGLLFGVLVLALVLIAFVAAFVSYAFTPIYLIEYNKKSNTDFGSSEIIEGIKKHTSKLIFFILFIFLLAIPLAIVLGISMLILIITIVGILAIPLVIALISLIFQSSLLEYLDSDKGIWECYTYAFQLIKTRFWHAVGCAGIMLFIALIVNQGISTLFTIFGFASTTMGLQDGSLSEAESIKQVFSTMGLLFIATYLVQIITNALLQINQGIIYFSLKEENENKESNSEIDQIGSTSEF